MSREGAQPILFSEGISGPHVDAYRQRVRKVVHEAIVPLVEEAEAARRFPRAAVEAFGAAGLYRERWAGPDGDAGRALVLSEELGRSGVGGIGVGLLVQSESVVPLLRRFGRTQEVARWKEAVLDGQAIGCVAASELAGGSDLASVATTVRREGDGWRIRGLKAYASPAGAADFCLALCRMEGDSSGPVPKLAVALVERQHFEARRLETAGCRSLETARLTIDGVISPEHLLAMQGLGLYVLNWGLTYERFASAAQALGGADTAIRLAATHLRRRHQFGAPLFDQQALRIRLASLAAEVLFALGGLAAMASRWSQLDQRLMREAAAAKVTAALLSERVLSECTHLFGGAGYLEDETPFPRFLRDMRLARLGGGSNEMMWELYAQGLEGDDALYDRLVSIEQSSEAD